MTLTEILEHEYLPLKRLALDKVFSDIFLHLLLRFAAVSVKREKTFLFTFPSSSIRQGKQFLFQAREKFEYIEFLSGKGACHKIHSSQGASRNETTSRQCDGTKNLNFNT